MPSIADPRAGIGPLLSTMLIGLIGLLLAGCATDSGDGSTSHPASQSSAQPSTRHDETPRNDLTDESVASWSRYEQVSTNQLRFFYTGGDPACYGVRLTTQATDTTVAVATIVGIIPGAPAHCTLVASLSSVILTTDKPIGERTVAHLESPQLHR